MVKGIEEASALLEEKKRASLRMQEEIKELDALIKDETKKGKARWTRIGRIVESALGEIGDEDAFKTWIYSFADSGITFEKANEELSDQPFEDNDSIEAVWDRLSKNDDVNAQEQADELASIMKAKTQDLNLQGNRDEGSLEDAVPLEDLEIVEDLEAKLANAKDELARRLKAASDNLNTTAFASLYPNKAVNDKYVTIPQLSDPVVAVFEDVPAAVETCDSDMSHMDALDLLVNAMAGKGLSAEQQTELILAISHGVDFEIVSSSMIDPLIPAEDLKEMRIHFENKLIGEM